MRTALAALTAWAAVSGISAQTGKSAESSAVKAAVTQFVDAFNKGDLKTIAAVCADQTDIVDEFPPHQWHGAGACTKWTADFDADAKKRNITDAVVTLGQFRHVDVSGNVAYVVVTGDYDFKLAGKPVKETSSTMTLVLHKSAGKWRLSAWTWSKA